MSLAAARPKQKNYKATRAGTPGAFGSATVTFVCGVVRADGRRADGH